MQTAGLVVVFFVPGEAACFSSPAVFAVGFDKPTKVCGFEEAVLRGRQNPAFYCWRACLWAGAWGKRLLLGVRTPSSSPGSASDEQVTLAKNFLLSGPQVIHL